MKQNINLILIILIYLINIIDGSTNYVVRPASEDILQKCPGYENNSYEKFFDLSKLKFDRISEDVVETSGIIKYIGDLPANTVISGEMKFYKKVSGSWVETLSLYRENVCAVLFKETEPWYSFTRYIDKKDRKCPPDAKFQTKVNKITLQYIQEAPSTNIEGDYKLITILRYGRDSVVCVMAYAAVEIA